MDERIILQTDGSFTYYLGKAGTLAEWQQEVARYAVGNSRLVLSISAAFAAPLLYPTGNESGGFHLRGASSTGKSTALIVAGSVWGGGGMRGFVRTWRTTGNGLEAMAEGHCDMLLCLDELGQVDAAQASEIAYMLANGTGKVRAGRYGGSRRIAEWRLLFLSSGEISLADKIAEGGRGRRVAAGQEVRVVDIPVDTGCGLGLFEDLHGFPSADALAQHLKHAAMKFYGTAQRVFIPHLERQFAEIAPTANGYVAEFLKEHVPTGADGQVMRVARRFALVAAGGEMATAYGVVPWPAGEATKAAAKCFRDWLTGRGGLQPTEEMEGVAAVRRFIEMHGTSRFEPMGENGDGESVIRTINRVGFRRSDGNGGTEYLVLPEAWKSEVCAGFDATMVAKALVGRGLLIGRGGKTSDFQRLPGFGPTRCYRLAAGILGSSDHA